MQLTERTSQASNLQRLRCRYAYELLAKKSLDQAAIQSQCCLGRFESGKPSTVVHT